MTEKINTDLDAIVAKTANSFVDFIDNESRSYFDYTITSLVHLDELLSLAYTYISFPYEKETIVLHASCYALETIRKVLGGEYEWNEEKSSPVLSVTKNTTNLKLIVNDRITNAMENPTDEKHSVALFLKEFVNEIEEAIDSYK